MTARPAPAWRVAGTTVTGARHAAEGARCQDYHRIAVLPSGLLVAVVSDGAGSARFGDEGARIVCDTLVDAFSAAPLPGQDLSAPSPPAAPARALVAVRRLVRAGVETARRAVTQEAEDRGVGIDAFHATLVGALIMPGVGGAFFHIGDGAALALDAGAQRWLLSAPANGEFADTTFFFTQSGWRSHLRVSGFDGDYPTVLLMSDGVTDIGLRRSIEGTVPHMPFFDPICRFLAANDRAVGEGALHATLDSPAVRERTGDDKTLVWAHWAAGP